VDHAPAPAAGSAVPPRPDRHPAAQADAVLEAAAGASAAHAGGRREVAGGTAAD
jgi:hypothetical protein